MQKNKEAYMVIENEWKFLVDKEQFYSIQKFFESNFSVRKENFEQINFYYDTDDLRLAKERITARIRDKNNQLKGTFKKHFESGISNETEFDVNSIPQTIMYNDITLKKIGFLTTVRTVFYIEGICEICFDESHYLGKMDYEIEVEFIDEYVGIIYFPKKTKTPSKYDRFLKKHMEEVKFIKSKENNM